MKTYFAAYLFTLVAFLVIDFIWLSTMASRLYRPAIGDLLAENFRLAPAVVFYLIYAAGLTFLAVRPAFQTGNGRPHCFMAQWSVSWPMPLTT